jgi:hypothetical protein
LITSERDRGGTPGEPREDGRGAPAFAGGRGSSVSPGVSVKEFRRKEKKEKCVSVKEFRRTVASDGKMESVLAYRIGNRALVLEKEQKAREAFQASESERLRRAVTASARLGDGTAFQPMQSNDQPLPPGFQPFAGMGIQIGPPSRTTKTEPAVRGLGGAGSAAGDSGPRVRAGVERYVM